MEISDPVFCSLASGGVKKHFFHPLTWVILIFSGPQKNSFQLKKLISIKKNSFRLKMNKNFKKILKY